MWTIYYSGTSTGIVIPEISAYNSDRYELVEKKDWKLNQLKKELSYEKDVLKYQSDFIDEKISKLAERQKEIDSLEKQIKELEQ